MIVRGVIQLKLAIKEGSMSPQENKRDLWENELKNIARKVRRFHNRQRKNGTDFSERISVLRKHAIMLSNWLGVSEPSYE